MIFNECVDFVLHVIIDFQIFSIKFFSKGVELIMKKIL